MSNIEIEKFNDKPNSTERIYNCILSGIISNTYKPGQVLSEPEIAEKYQISRTPVREALNKLEGEGFVIRNGAKRMVYQLTPDDIDQLFELKIAIEGMIAHKAALSDDVDMRDDLQDIVTEMEQYVDAGASRELDRIMLDNWINLDVRFHTLLYRMAHNNRAKSIVDNLNAQWHRFRLGISAVSGHLERSVAEHLKIGNAVLEHNPEAAREAMEGHFRNLQEQIKQVMKVFSAS